MKTLNEAENFREYRTVDKSAWPVGPWNAEPDKVQWIDAATGLDCLIVRGPSGALCGYVGVDESHPWHRVGYNGCTHKPACGEGYCTHSPGNALEVHGGITFSDACSATEDESRHICHVAAPGRADHVWWFGFDCAHYRDRTPKFEGELGRDSDSTYRDIEYVRGDVESLARQLKGAA